MSCNEETCLHLQPRLMLSSTSPLRLKSNWLNLPIVGYLETLVPFLKYLRISRRLWFTFRSLAALSSASPRIVQLIHIAPLTTSPLFGLYADQDVDFSPLCVISPSPKYPHRHWCVQQTLLRCVALEVFYVISAPFPLKMFSLSP